MSYDPITDWNPGDIEFAIAKPHGMTLKQVFEMDFPPNDDMLGSMPIWRNETVLARLEGFHTAMHVMARASRPEDFERFLEMLRELMREEGGDDATS